MSYWMATVVGSREQSVTQDDSGLQSSYALEIEAELAFEQVAKLRIFPE
jgi:hypothetical protein